MGTISGIEFVAEVVLDTGETKVTYLVRHFDLEDTSGDWFAGSLQEVELIQAQSDREGGPPPSKLN